MRSVFADTNVFLDYLLQRVPGAVASTRLFIEADARAIHLYTSSSNLVNVIYFLEKAGLKQSRIVSVVSGLLSFIKLVSPSEHAFLAALNAGYPDLEDAVQYHTALQISSITHFVTSNIRDYKKASGLLPVVTPVQMVSLLTAT